ncbi:hypothetical protein BPAE_0203g00070 [Botrytis paeoniae]|uniref:Uncharacterized protein n=1 Tax=Botrytis paeoniae TaxID=278948 RepID=A0A4Z1FG03_9HELO|nr:hypothetical protein BPAE_0203g00070 [Botrytis paeoniae]
MGSSEAAPHSHHSHHSRTPSVPGSTHSQSQSEVKVTSFDKKGKERERTIDYAESAFLTTPSSRSPPPASSIASSRASGSTVKPKKTHDDGKTSSTTSRGSERWENKIPPGRSNIYNPGAQRAPSKAPHSHKPNQGSIAPRRYDDDEVNPDDSISRASIKPPRTTNAAGSSYTSRDVENFKRGLEALSVAKGTDSGQRGRPDEPQSRAGGRAHAHGSAHSYAPSYAPTSTSNSTKDSRKESEAEKQERREAKKAAIREAARREAEKAAEKAARKKRHEGGTSDFGGSLTQGVDGSVYSSTSSSTSRPPPDRFSQVSKGSRTSARSRSVAGSVPGTKTGSIADSRMTSEHHRERDFEEYQRSVAGGSNAPSSRSSQQLVRHNGGHGDPRWAETEMVPREARGSIFGQSGNNRDSEFDDCSRISDRRRHPQYQDMELQTQQASTQHLQYSTPAAQINIHNSVYSSLRVSSSHSRHAPPARHHPGW